MRCCVVDRGARGAAEAGHRIGGRSSGNPDRALPARLLLEVEGRDEGGGSRNDEKPQTGCPARAPNPDLFRLCDWRRSGAGTLCFASGCPCGLSLRSPRLPVLRTPTGLCERVFLASTLGATELQTTGVAGSRPARIARTLSTARCTLCPNTPHKRKRTSPIGCRWAKARSGSQPDPCAHETGVMASCPPSTARTLSTASRAIAWRVSRVALPRCGVSTTRSRSRSRPGWTFGSFS